MMTEQDKLAAIECVEELGPCSATTVYETLGFDSHVITRDLLNELVADKRISRMTNGQYLSASAKKTIPAPSGTPARITNATSKQLAQMVRDGKLAKAEIRKRIKNI